MFTIATLAHNGPIHGRNKKVEFQTHTVLCRTENERKYCGLKREQSVIWASEGSTSEGEQGVLEHDWSSVFARF